MKRSLLITVLGCLLLLSAQGQTEKAMPDSIKGSSWHNFNIKHDLCISAGVNYSMIAGNDLIVPPSVIQVNVTSPYWGYYQRPTGSFHAGIYYSRYLPYKYLKFNIGIFYINRRSLYQSDTVTTKQYQSASYHITEYDVSSNSIEFPLIGSYYQGNFSFGIGFRYSVFNYIVQKKTSILYGTYRSIYGWQTDIDAILPTVQVSYKLKIGKIHPVLYAAIDRRENNYCDILLGITVVSKMVRIRSVSKM